MSDSFYFVHQALTGNGSITVRVTSLSERGAGCRTGALSGPWCRGRRPGSSSRPASRRASAYAAIMVTGSHGVRMQDDYTGDVAGPAVARGLAAADPVRLDRSPVTRPPTGPRWTRVGAVTLPGLPATVQGGLFTTSPQYTQTSLGVAAITGNPSQSTAVFDHAALTWPAAARGPGRRGRLVRRPRPAPRPGTPARAASSRSPGPVTSGPSPTGRRESARHPRRPWRGVHRADHPGGRPGRCSSPPSTAAG